MKQWCVASMLCGAVATTVLAQAPVDDPPAPPAPVAAEPAVVRDVFVAAPRVDVKWGQGKTEKAVVLGVNASAASAAMREQLKLPRGVGLVVDSVEKETAAEAAGVKQHDIIEKLDDQLLVNPQQLTALVRAKKAGDEVTLTVVRQGERVTLKGKLTEKDVAVGGANDWTMFLDHPVAMNFDNADAFPRPGLAAVTVRGGKTLPGRMIVRDVNGRQTTDWSDAEHDLTLDRENGRSTHLKAVERKTGRVVFEGAIETDEQRKGVPPEVMKKLEAAEATPPADGPKALRIVGGGVGGGGGFGAAGAPGFGGAGTRGRVLQWQDDGAILMIRAIGKAPTYLMALSKKDGRVIYDGPVQTDEQRKSLPPEISEQFQMLLDKPELAKEFGAPEGGKL